MRINEVMSVSTVRKLQESKELAVVYPRPINRIELELAKEFQKFCTMIHDYIYGQQASQQFDEHIVQELLIKFKEFKRYGFLSKFIKELEEALDSHYKMKNSAVFLKHNAHHIKNHTNDIADLLMAGDFDAAHNVSDALNSMLSNIDHHVDIHSVTKRELKRKFTETPTFFGTTSFLKTVDANLYEKIIHTNLDEYKFTYLDFPRQLLQSDFHYVLNFILNLQNSSKPVRITDEDDFRKYISAANKGKPDYEELASIFDRYLHSNDKNLIPRILQLIEKNPSLKAANEKAKRKIKKVYRGVAYDGNDDVLGYDRAQQFVATSTSKRAATNFALAKGHLDAERRSEIGYLITYSVTPADIILDTSIFMTVYSESEVLINAKTAGVEDLEEV